jgi:O-antigen/teichoic acid export membrane protein
LSAVGSSSRPEGLRRIFRNLAHLLGGKAAAGLISLGYLLLVTRILGAHDYGILVLVNGYVMLVATVVTFSGWHVIVHYGHQALRDGDLARLMSLVRAMAAIEAGLALLAILVAILLVPLVGPRLHWSPEVMRLAGFYSLAIVTGVRATSQGLVQLVRRVDLLGVAQLTSPLVRLVGTTVIYFAGGGLSAFLALWLLSALLEAIGFWTLGLWALQQVRQREPIWGPMRGVRSNNDGFVKFIVSTNVDITLRDFAPALVPVVIGWSLGPVAAGIYALAQRAASLFQQPAKFLTNSAFAVFAELAALSRYGVLRRLVWRTGLTVLAAALPLLAVIFALGDRLIIWLGGSSFASGAALMMMLAVGQAAYLANPVFSAGLTALGRAASSIAVNLATQLGLLPLLLLLIHLRGLDGVGWYVLLSGTIASAAMMAAFHHAVGAAARSAVLSETPPTPHAA